MNQPASEGRDVSLTLPDKQDDLVNAVAAANRRTIVVLETGGPVNMPWADRVPGILEAWYPGIRGGEAIANILFGDVNPSGKTVLTFARNEADWPYSKPFAPDASATATGAPGRGGAPFDLPYSEGLKVGYKWFDAEGKAPLFAFGHGLSYTTFSYSGLRTAIDGRDMTVSFTLRNSGTRDGIEIAQVYAGLPAGAGEPPRRLVAWKPVPLQAGEECLVTLRVDPLHLSIFDVSRDEWEVVGGDYRIWVGSSSRDLPLSESVTIGR